MDQKILAIPTRRQVEALTCPANELFFGGARGGGKTYVGILDYIKQLPILGGRARGIAFRRTYRELADIIDKAKELLLPIGFKYNKGDNYFEHPNNAKYTLSYLERPEDAEGHQGFAYSHIFFDEIGNYKSLLGIELMKATLRGFPVPPRIIATANPGGRAHQLIKNSYPIDNPMQLHIDSDGWSKIYIPSLFTDNHYLVKNDPNYIARATSNLPEYLRQAWRYGNWNITSEAGMFFHRSDFEIERKAPECISYVRAWDRAATIPSDTNQDPDWTVGVLMGKTPLNETFVIDVIRVRMRAADVKRLIRETASRDGIKTEIVLFKDPGQAGKDQSEDMARYLSGYIVRVKAETGAKHDRWMPFSAAVQNKVCRLVEGKWNSDYIDELVTLTDVPKDYGHDDQADASAGAYTHLNQPNIPDFYVFDDF
jgi:predicted phage terminase large subunit-like protein